MPHQDKRSVYAINGDEHAKITERPKHRPDEEKPVFKPIRAARPLLFRLLFVALAAVFVVQGLSALYAARMNADQSAREAAQREAIILDTRAKLMGPPLWKLQYEVLDSMLQEIMVEPTILAADVYDDSGALITGKHKSVPYAESYRSSVPIFFRDGAAELRAGHLELALKRPPFLEEFWQRLSESLVVALLSAAMIILLLWAVTQRFIGRPLNLIVDAMARTQSGQGGRHKVTWRSNDEFGIVVDAFNDMQDYANRSERQLLDANRRLDFLAKHDDLTGLPNRRSFEERLAILADMARRKNTAIAVHFVDIDHFKNVNDTRGHTAGDLVLQHVAKQLVCVVAPGHVLHPCHEAYGLDCSGGCVSRFGGDEFVVLQYGVASDDDARDFAKRLSLSVQSPCLAPDASICVTASVGSAVLDVCSDDIAHAFQLVDCALHAAKGRGDGQVVLLSREMRESYERRKTLELEIVAGIANKEFTLFYQPQVNFETGLTVGLEALVRWRHPTRGVLAPGAFLSIIEEMGLNNRFGAHLICEALQAVRDFRDRGIGHVRVAINLSAAQLVDPEFAQQFLRQISDYGVTADGFAVEITEETLIRHFSQARANLEALREAGVKVALDDFGTGYSSLSYIRLFPIDCIKIDRSFVQELPDIPQTAAIVRVIRDLARDLNAGVVAEGVERQTELDCLRALNVQVVQGYFFSPARSFAEICDWLEREKPSVRMLA